MRKTIKPTTLIKVGAFACLLASSQLNAPTISMPLGPNILAPEGVVLPEVPRLPDTVLRINPGSLIMFFNLGEYMAENGERITLLQLFKGGVPVEIKEIDTGKEYIGREKKYLYTIETGNSKLQELSPFDGLPLLVGETGVTIESNGEAITDIPHLDFSVFEPKQD